MYLAQISMILKQIEVGQDDLSKEGKFKSPEAKALLIALKKHSFFLLKKGRQSFFFHLFISFSLRKAKVRKVVGRKMPNCQMIVPLQILHKRTAYILDNETLDYR